MRIALITDGIWPYVIGGMQKHSYFLCKYFAKNGIYIDLVHFNNSTFDISLLEFFSEEEKKFITPVIVNLPVSKKFPGHYIYNSYLHSKLIFEALKEKLKHYDFIYAKGFAGWYLINAKHKGEIKCCPIGVNFHGYEVLQPAPTFKVKIQQMLFLKNPIIKLSKKADVVFSYGGKITELIKQIGVKSANIIEMPSGIEADSLAAEIKPCDEIKHFLFIGRYERRKGIEELTRAIALLLKEKTRPFEFHFIGNIPEEKKLLNSNVFYHGEIRNKTDLFNEIKKHDVLVCPSYSEGFPNVILEAMASGLAIAATPVGAVELLVNNQVGWIINKPTVIEILNILNKVLQESPESVFAKKQEAFNSVKNKFSWDKIIRDLILKIENKTLEK